MRSARQCAKWRAVARRSFVERAMAAATRRRRSAPAARRRRRGASARAPRAGVPCGARARRSGAAVAIACCPGRRHSTPQVRPSRAATASRRSTRSSCGPSHANAAPHSGARSACSYAHSSSAPLRQRTISSRARSSPAAASAGAYGRCGGAIQTTSRRPACRRASAGSVSRISPMPSRASSDLGQRRLRPAAPGQHGVELRKAARHRRRLGRAVAAAPDRGIGEDGGERGVRRRRHRTSVNRQPPPIAFAARFSSSSGGTSSTCVAMYQW